MARLGCLILAIFTACSDHRSPDHAFIFSVTHGPTLAEWRAAMTAQAVLSDAAMFADTTDPSVVEIVAGAIAQLPDAVIAHLRQPDQAEQALLAAPDDVRGGALTSGRDLTDAMGATLPQLDPACLAVTASTLTYSGCKTTMTVDGADSVVMLDGSISQSRGAIAWDLLEIVTATTLDSEGKRVVHLTGRMTVGEGAITGEASSETHSLEVTPSRVVTTGWSTIADVAATTTASPFCVVSGTLELRRIWTDRETDLPFVWPYVDGAFRFSWKACGAFAVQRSW